jgi:hypothetical protein
MYSFSIYFLQKNKLCSEVLCVKSLPSPVTGDVIKTYLTNCLSEYGFLDNLKPKLMLWGVSDEGSNVLRAMKSMTEEGLIHGHHACFNHKLQNAIKDCIKGNMIIESK